MARYQLGTAQTGDLAGNLLWLKVLPVGAVIPSPSPIAAGKPSPLADEPGFEVWVEPTTQMVTAPFSGSMHIDGMGDLASPTNAYATALLGVDLQSGTVNFAKSIAKGPKSVGKPSHATAVKRASGFVYADTVWDSIDFGGGKTATSVSGADVVIAVLDQQGNAKQVSVYGGMGDDEPLGIDPTLTVFGRSNASIDFGNGSLTPTPGKTEIWFASFNNR